MSKEQTIVKNTRSKDCETKNKLVGQVEDLNSTDINLKKIKNKMNKKVLVGEMEDLKSKHTNLNDNLSDIQASLSSLNAAVAQLGFRV
jgi:hypothetical protein